MPTSKKVLLFDIDYTLFNQDSYRDMFFPLLAKEIGVEDEAEFLQIKRATDEKIRKIAGYFDPILFLQELIKYARKPVDGKNLENIFFNNDIYKTSLYADTIHVLDQLAGKKKYIIGILSTGHTKHQRKKIEQLKKYFQDVDVHIFPDKIKKLQHVLNKYKNRNVYIIDDNSGVLYAAKNLDKNIQTVWIKRQRKYEDIPVNDTFRADYTFSDLSAILSILR